MLNNIISELKATANEVQAVNLSRFFKTGKGQYGEGDKFLGITVPKQRVIAKKFYQDITLKDIEKLLSNKFHEVRLTALLMLTYKMAKADINEQKAIVDLYLTNTAQINNWDLVDLSAAKILGYYLYENKINRDVIYQLAKSKNLWEQRIAIISTAYFINHKEYNDTLAISTQLLNHSHDLIHKAVGWMLREVGKKDYDVEYTYLVAHYHSMPRTMLRYAIERFEEQIRLRFLRGEI